MKRKPIFITTLIILSLTFTLAKTNAHKRGYIIHSLYGTTPTIDGTLSPQEWSDATTLTFNYTTTYIKHDGESLYFAFNISDPTLDPPNEGALIYIDTNHNGSLYPSDDIAFILARNGTALEMIGPPSSPKPPDGNWTATTQETSGGYTAEFNITYKKINITKGIAKTLGLLLGSYDSTPYPGKIYYWPPQNDDVGMTPSYWGDLTAEDNWIPEFQPLIAITALMTAALITTIIHRKQTRKRLKLQPSD